MAQSTGPSKVSRTSAQHFIGATVGASIVHQQHLWLRDQRTRYLRAKPPRRCQVARAHLQGVRQFEALEHFGHALGALQSRPPVGGEQQVLPDRQVREQRVARTHPSAAPPARRQIHLRFGVEHDGIVNQYASGLRTREACDRFEDRRFPRARQAVQRRDPVRQVQIDIELLVNDACVGHKAATMDHSANTRTKATPAAARIGRQPSGSITRQKIRHSEQPRLRAASPYSRFKSCKGRRAPSTIGGSCRNHPGRGAGLPREYGPQKDPRQNHHRRRKQQGQQPQCGLTAGKLPRGHPVYEPESQHQRDRRRNAGDLETKPHRRPIEGHRDFQL